MLSVILWILLPLAVQSIDWRGDWAPACDFNNKYDFTSAQVSAELCGSTCASTKSCTHYTWNKGTCWMKKGPGRKEDAFDTNNQDALCGIVAGSIDWNENWAKSCDFLTEDISSSQTTLENCGSVCESTEGCTNFAWTGFQGGTCWLKRGKVSKADAYFTNDQTMICGLANGGGGSGDLWVSYDQFSAAVTGNGCPAPRYDQYEAFINGIPQSRISSVREMAMFLAQMIHESAGLTVLREIRCQQTGCVGEYLPPGPNGVVYYGRGYIQLTWDFNYRPASQYLYNDENVLLNNPEIVADDQYAAWGSAFWYWATNVHDAPGVQEGLFGASTKAINGPIECSGGWNPQAQQRFQYYTVVLPSFGVFEQPNEAGCY